MKIVTDDEILPFIKEKMRGTMILADNESEDDVIAEYFAAYHTNYMTDDDNGFVCVGIYEDYCVVHFAWFDGRYETRKGMVNIGRHIYSEFTKKRNMPLLYQGKRNFYGNHSVKYDNGIWQFVL